MIRCPNFRVKVGDKGIMCFAGSIRGAIAFGLAIGIESKQSGVLVSTTLVLVFFTTVFFGALMPQVVAFFKKSENMQQVHPIERELSDDTTFERYSIQRYESPDEK